jgi:hypothetical protein
MSLSDIQIHDVCAAIGFLYGHQIDDELQEELADVGADTIDRLRRLLALREAQGGVW